MWRLRPGMLMLGLRHSKKETRVPHQSVLITGGAAGIGRATAARFIAEGWQVGAIDRDQTQLNALRNEFGDGNVWTHCADVCDPEAVDAAIEAFMGVTGGRLDVVVNNAGLVAAGPFEAGDIARYRAVVDVNVTGVVTVARAAFPYLAATPGARLINMSSASAAYGTPGYAVYSATKHAVSAFTEALDAEWHRHGIRVRAVWPLFVQTAMVTEIGPQRTIDRMGVRLRPDDVAGAIARASGAPHWWPQLHWTVGWQGFFFVNLTRFCPTWINRLAMRWIAGY